MPFKEIKGEGLLVILEGEMVMTKMIAHWRERETFEKGKENEEREKGLLVTK